jgi:hypothetical protein
MIIDITGVTSGTSPYDIFLCDWTLTSCFYVSGVTSIPPTVHIDSDNYFPNLELLQIKIIDGAGCVFTEPQPCPVTPTPTPTPTPTFTPTPTPTFTPTPTPTFTPTPTPTPCNYYRVGNIGDGIIEVTFTPCCGEINISPYGLSNGNFSICSSTTPITSSVTYGTVTLLSTCPTC